MIPTRRPPPLASLLAFAMLAGGGLGFGGSGRPDFEPGPPPRPNMPPRPALPPEPPKRDHQPVFTPKQKASRAKRKAQRKARKR